MLAAVAIGEKAIFTGVFRPIIANSGKLFSLNYIPRIGHFTPLRQFFIDVSRRTMTP